MKKRIQTLSKLEMSHLVGGNAQAPTAVQTEHSHQTTNWLYYITGEKDYETCGDSYADGCCE